MCIVASDSRLSARLERLRREKEVRLTPISQAACRTEARKSVARTQRLGGWSSGDFFDGLKRVRI